MTDEFVCRARQVVFAAQQKSAGIMPPHGDSVVSPPHVEVSLGVSTLFPASGSNSSCIQMTRADDGKRRKERASADVTACIVKDIKEIDTSVPAVEIRAQRCMEQLQKKKRKDTAREYKRCT